MKLEAAVLELVVFATQNNFDPRELKVPEEGFRRSFEHKGKRYKATLTRMTLDSGKPKNYLWLLSVSYDPNMAVLPTEAEGAEIASAFFSSWRPIPADLDTLKWSRKYIMQEVEK
jgi:hypothetical protein